MVYLITKSNYKNYERNKMHVHHSPTALANYSNYDNSCLIKNHQSHTQLSQSRIAEFVHDPKMNDCRRHACVSKMAFD